MSNTKKIIPADIIVDSSLAHSLIERDFPEITVESVHLIGEGWDNVVFLVNNDLVFRFPRREIAVPLLHHEILVISAAKSKLPIAIPEPAYLGHQHQDFPWPYYGHKVVRGRTGCQVLLTLPQFEAAAATLGLALKTLHRIDLTTLDKKISSPEFDRINFTRMRESLSERKGPITKHLGLELLDGLIEAVLSKAQTYEPGKLSLVHGDLYHRHLIFSDANELVGMIDWGDAGVSDPVVDLCVLYQFFPRVSHKAFFDVYGPISDGATAYAQFLALYYAVTLFWFGKDRQDSSLTVSSVKTIDYLLEDFSI